MRIAPLTALICLLLPLSVTATPANFGQAKLEARQYIYYDRHTQGDAYCGCNWTWTGRSGGRVDLAGCGYQVRAQANRAQRIEWEHIVPASDFGRQRQCWQQGGRAHCTASDPMFSIMEADLHNLTPVVGEVNADRSNYGFGLLTGTPAQHGQCDVRVDFAQRTVQPRAAFRGQIARTYFYMADRYDLRLSSAQQRLFMAWDRQYPVSDWERERDRRVAARMGHGNPFVSGVRQWSLNHRNSRDGLVSVVPGQAASAVVHGNRNSHIYHLSHCPGYTAMAERNRVSFSSPASAEAAGYRRARNCP
ncbi:EndA [Alcanivorax sp. S71-1-4]|uniref:endonuclease n=1 Tax=Alcanivorax sp. S71-1-4 TaxID=1177159 RepID=UPI00135BB58F|nr:endonuclease [Alcanivorax sp. S71-1-4]KAF0805852.1 EndA [Alcanivorax sp. S71-1-4]